MLTTLQIISYLIIIPNLIAAHTLSQNNAYKTNRIYVFGYLLFIGYNVYIKEFGQVLYFVINWCYAVMGVLQYSKGYQPVGTLYLSNPPQGGSGLPSKRHKKEGD